MTTMTRKAIIKVLDEVNCVLIGLDPKDNKWFQDKFSPFAQNYRFSKKYKLGQWDGRISFYSKGGKTYVNLLDQIIPQLKKWGYKIELLDNREQFTLDIPVIDEKYLEDVGIILGDHQVKGINAITQNNGGIVLAGTGAGKSIMCAAMSLLYHRVTGLKVIMIVPTSDLVLQGVEDFRDLEIDVGEYSGDNKDINHPIVISTWQALQNNPEMMGMFQVAIVDECHGVTGKELQNILNNYGAHLYVKIGVTGTLPEPDVDKMSVNITLGTPQFTITSKELIDSGWLAKLMINMLELVEDHKAEYAVWQFEFPEESKGKTYNDFLEVLYPEYDIEKRKLNKNDRRLEYVKKLVEAKRANDKGNTLILVNGVEVGQKLAALIEGSYFVYAKDKKVFRKMVYDLFKDNDDVVAIATSQLASTGLNIPRIFYLFFLDLGKSYIRTIQAIGRGLRKAKDKDFVEVIDISSNLKYSKIHQRKRVEHYKKHEYPFTKHKIEYTKNKG